MLKGPYEISVWGDVWDSNSGKFKEERLGVIGSDTMTYQGRVFSPQLTRKTNGEKKLSFQLYKQFVDTITGEKINNPFAALLTNERKVKLYYQDKWYDFVIKDIDEQSSKKTNSYQLEDALVQELSKNGFNIVLDNSKMNNSGTVKELATEVLKETDWIVSNKSEVNVQTIEENLVYLQVIQEGGINAYHVIDQKEDKSIGVVANTQVNIPKNSILLGFFSCCQNKPYRFQFIYLDDLDKIKRNSNRIIINEDCQYYIDNPTYNISDTYGMIVPTGLKSYLKVEEKDYAATLISALYRGRRYGFHQKSVLVPVLNRYVDVYKQQSSNTEVYGYCDTQYVSPILIQNIISNTSFKNTSGWTGSAKTANAKQATVENVFGRFDSGKFIDAIDELSNVGTNKHKAYLRITFGSNSNAAVINSGPYDNRTSIKNMEVGDKWLLKIKALNSTGGNLTTRLTATLGEYVYEPNGDYYKAKNDSGLTFTSEGSELTTNGKIFTVKSTSYNEKTFKKNSKVRLMFTGSGVVYIESIELFKAIYKDDKLITPEEQVNYLENSVIDNTYRFFDKTAIDNISSADELSFIAVEKTLDYTKYAPVFNEGAEKIRSVTAKESNYFNILQSIAETFESWIDFQIIRDDYGGITGKEVIFKNYVGKENPVGFRYGINLNNIKRTLGSKNIVTKLIVKQNSNEFANNGFCTIARAAANETGENFIYDFQYFFNTGLLNARDYLETLAIPTGTEIDTTSLSGYFYKLKRLNQQIDSQNEILINTSQDKTRNEANLQVAEAGWEAANSGIEQVRDDIKRLTDHTIEQLTDEDRKSNEVIKLLTEYCVYQQELSKYAADKEKYNSQQNSLNETYNDLKSDIDTLTKQKQALNQLFFSVYSRFIQEGTWISEEYVNDNLYYADALSVLYNSCYPKVAYSIDTIDVRQVPEYSDYKIDLGDQTYVEDPEFFGDEYRVEVVVTEVTEDLDNPSKTKIKVQNFKDQFQDLFQRITATVQQAQYSTGSYEKAVALVEAGQERKMQFLTDALNAADARLAAAGEQSVTWGNDGITVRSVDSPCDAIRMVGGAILLSKQDKNGEQKWVTGVTSDGISASLITAGILNAGEITIMNYDQPLFRWDSHGLSAFDAIWSEVNGVSVIGGVNQSKFVRFDKHGIYGITEGVDSEWYPTDIEEIHEKATFALTWDGLKVTGSEGATAWLGKQGVENNEYIFTVKNPYGKDTFRIKSDGSVELAGTIHFSDDLDGDTLSNKLEGLQDSIDGVSNDLSDFEDEVGNYLNPGTTAIGSQYVISPHIAGGYLHITNGDDSVTINPEGVSGADNAIFAVKKGGNLVIGFDAEGNAHFNGIIEASGGNFTNCTIDNKCTIQGTLDGATGNFSGEITAKKGQIGGWYINDNNIASTENDGTIDEIPNVFLCVDGWSQDLSVGAGLWNGIQAAMLKVGDKFIVDVEGKLFATNVSIAGEIQANEGDIGGWQLDESSIYSKTFVGGLPNVFLDSREYGFPLAINMGQNEDYEMLGIVFKAGTGFAVDDMGNLFAENAYLKDATVEGTLTAGTGSKIGDWEISDGSITTDIPYTSCTTVFSQGEISKKNPYGSVTDAANIGTYGSNGYWKWYINYEGGAVLGDVQVNNFDARGDGTDTGIVYAARVSCDDLNISSGGLLDCYSIDATNIDCTSVDASGTITASGMRCNKIVAESQVVTSFLDTGTIAVDGGEYIPTTIKDSTGNTYTVLAKK